MLFGHLFTALAFAASAYSTQMPLHMSSIGHRDFTTLTNARFPDHRIRIKQTAFCDPTVNVYTGYLDVDEGAKHLFFYFFESRRDPATDDVVMWINGGPGCSSATGLLMELGPCNIDLDSNGTTFNPYSWNSFTNIFFLDQPVGVGFSYADFGETVETTEQAAKNIYSFISLFFEAFPQFEGRALHLSGESYGGRYLPVFASEIYDQNKLATIEGRPVINLQSVIIGNGITDISTLYPGRYEIECGRAALDVPFQTIGNCVRMKTALPRCQKLMKDGCIDKFDMVDCAAAVAFCDTHLSTAMWATGRNVYDISKPCLGSSGCYLEGDAIANYLSNSTIREALGVDTSVPTPFVGCSNTVSRLFVSHLDKWAVPNHFYIAGLLERGVRVLIYAGTLDWQCNWAANRMWVDKLEWSGAKEYRALEWAAWSAGGKGTKAGEVKQSEGLPLAFVTLYGAGHMVPHDVPEESLEMLSACFLLDLLNLMSAQNLPALLSRIRQLLPASLPPSAAYILPASTLTALGHPTLLGPLFTHVAGDDPKTVSLHLRDVLLKEWTLIGIPLVITALASLSTAEQSMGVFPDNLSTFKNPRWNDNNNGPAPILSERYQSGNLDVAPNAPITNRGATHIQKLYGAAGLVTSTFGQVIVSDL
ncbi:Carboxypeptidase [Mycena indigotica]|uniref:Carboxypeptidase n=1 Tax=Mycena indigotica TaxID=2126181 RepID=A0A8H6S669_9AGAR|nr:Carboxypeptidase [Mycena indigotica]KAF7292811.1 Carboxypeptidase [Mycena indigotica]